MSTATRSIPRARAASWTPRAALYLRISKDRTGEGLGVERQEQDCRALCERRGWEVADTYCDNDTSAYSGRTRPEWERLCSDIRAGAIDAVAVWHVDRLTRTPRELEDVITFAEQHGLELATCTGEVDLGSVTGRMTARILGSVARQESEHKAERQRREKRQAAEAGKVNGGGVRPYGYSHDRVTVREDEADVIREAARRILAGESLNSLARDLQSRGILTSAGNPWQPRTLRQLLLHARISGRREHLGAIVGPAVWPAIISPADSDRLRALLTRPDRQSTRPGNPRTYLLSGLLRCGRCGAAMIGRRRNSVPRYVCRSMPGIHACGGVATHAARTDDLVRDLVLVALAGPGLRKRLAAKRTVDPKLAASVERDQAKLIELAGLWADHRLGTAEWQAARDGVEKRLEANERALAQAAGPDPLPGFTGSHRHLSEQWEQMNTSQRRAVVAAVLEKVVVRPADPHRRWDPTRFEPVWKA